MVASEAVEAVIVFAGPVLSGKAEVGPSGEHTQAVVRW